MRLARSILIILLLPVLFVVATAGAQEFEPDDAAPQPGPQRIEWNAAADAERRAIDQMLASSDWAFRALALMRLDRYQGLEVNAMIERALGDAAWQVRCFAIRHATTQGLTIHSAEFETETDARVVRTALAHGVAVPDKVVNRLALKLVASKSIDSILLGIEIGAASNIERVRRTASRRAVALAREMNAQVAAAVTRRLAAAVGLDPPPENLLQWREWAGARDHDWTLPRPAPRAGHSAPRSLIASADEETFIRLRDYLAALRRRDLDLVIAIDATNSMTPMIDSVKADIDALILFLSDISSSLRLGLLAYRDHDNVGRLVEAHRLSNDIESIRSYLFGLRTPGGRTHPEAVFDGVLACREFDWREEAEREIIIVGDAPPHEADIPRIQVLLEWFRESGYVVHAVHVPMEYPRRFREAADPAGTQTRNKWLDDYNQATREIFADLAAWGGGRQIELDTASRDQLVRLFMKLTIEQDWWPYFDEFYDSYLALCR